MLCLQCGSEEFESEDGYLFCKMCNMQSQETRSFETTTFAGEQFSRGGTIHIKKGPKLKKPVSEDDRHIDFTTLEAFSMMLKRLVDSAICLGASRRLQPVVQDLWALYLKKVGISFTPAEDKARSSVLSGGIEVHSKDRQSEYLFISRKWCQDTNPETPKEDHSYGRSNENPVKMTISKLVGFLYLGVLEIKENILFCDIYRWARNEDLPLFKYSTVYPSGWIPNNVQKLMCKADALPSFSTLWTMTHKLGEFLGIDAQPSASVNLILARFVSELNLPGQLVAYTLRLMERIRLSSPTIVFLRHKHAPEVDVITAIFISLKMLFALDGCTEKELSEYARLLRKTNVIGNPFVFEEWMQDSEMQLYKDSLTNINSVRDCSAEVPDVGKMVALYTELYAEREVKAVHRLYDKPDVKKKIEDPLNLVYASLRPEDDEQEPPEIFSSNFPPRISFHRTDLQYLLSPEKSISQLSDQGFSVATIERHAIFDDKKSNLSRNGNETVYLFAPYKTYNVYVKTHSNTSLNAKTCGRSYDLLPTTHKRVLTLCANVCCVDEHFLYTRVTELENVVSKIKNVEL